MAGPSLLCCLFLLLSGVFGADEIKVSVMEGDSVPLLINAANTQGATDLWWRFNKKIIAKIDKEQGSATETFDKRFPDRLKLDNQIGSLNITDSKTSDSGLYELEIKSSRGSEFKRFNVTVREVKTVSVNEGDSVTLHTNVTEIQRADGIEWKFNGILIADLSHPAHERFSNSEMNPQTGDLTITNIRGDQSGDYEVEINRKSSQNIFRVIVRERMHPGWIAFIVLTILIVFAVIIYFIYHKIYKKQQSKDGENMENETHVHLNAETSNSKEEHSH